MLLQDRFPAIWMLWLAKNREQEITRAVTKTLWGVSYVQMSARARNIQKRP
jgi:hypothetical protein